MIQIRIQMLLNVEWGFNAMFSFYLHIDIHIAIGGICFLLWMFMFYMFLVLAILQIQMHQQHSVLMASETLHIRNVYKNCNADLAWDAMSG